ncbi:MAG TPA: 23S rRNA (adenine(2030)-N(6))-methyltransferase RlmJ [Steroidobacteraceae bacterium]|jgi:23S rRNA (adenine2030-N6)-methyltransferase|nr:23S rRNA (adenine(2030)-N(6))-methyltransferase RlmJ [Steroidobacteraceae bacterium]
MKYRHAFHAGNFADVHKHVALLALVEALKKKDKGFLYLDTHAGRGGYDLSSPTVEAAAGVARFTQAQHAAQELRAFAALLGRLRAARRHLYPGSPLIAVSELRPQDRAVLIELLGAEAHALAQALASLPPARGDGPRVRIERGDGFAALRAWLPPPERRGLTFLDPPYEETQQDFAQLTAALIEGLRRFPTGVFAAWYPIKDQRAVSAWLVACGASLRTALLVSELWLYPRDSRVGLNGSGLLIANPPWLTLERMQVWLPELQSCLAVGDGGGSSARMLPQST